MDNRAKQSTRHGSRRARRLKATSAWTLTPLRIALLAVVLVAFGGAGLFAYSQQDQAASPSNASGLSEHVAEVGESAPAFSLNGPYGETYTFQPGDGTPHLLVFYMGYF